jgi:hypothetical protein
MSRSFRKNPVTPNTTAKSEKFDKQKYNRRLRKINKVELEKESDIFSLKREISDIWDMPKDGKDRIPFPISKWLRK